MNAKQHYFTFVLLAGAIVSGLAQPTIIKQPANQTASLFADATFSLLVNGDPPLSYQWRFNNADFKNMTNRTLTVTNVQRGNAGNYNVVVSNPSGAVTSEVATLTITPFNSMYEFGYSWTDTQGIDCDWNPRDFYMHRASNGPLWPEFLSTNLGLAYPAANNHAHCGAGASDVLNQVIQFSVPPNPELSLYFLMFSDDILLGLPPLGPTDLNVTNQVAWNQVIQTGILINSNAVSQLYARGARAIVVQSEMDFGRSPAALTGFGTNIAGLSKFSEYCALYNTGFSNAVHAFGQTSPDLRIVWVDLFSKLNEVLANPALYGFTNTTNSALDDQSLSNKSFTGPGADYVFWNRLHVTSKLHKLISSWTLEALTNSVLERLEAIPGEGSPTIQMNHLQIGRDYTLQKSADLRIWNDLQSFTAGAGTNQWSGAVGDFGASYFRLKWEK